MVGMPNRWCPLLALNSLGLDVKSGIGCSFGVIQKWERTEREHYQYEWRIVIEISCRRNKFR